MNKSHDSLVTPRIRKARVATFIGFMMIGAMMYTWSTGVSVFRQGMGLAGAEGDLNFGLIALGIGIGAAAGSLLIGRLIDIFGPKKVVTSTLVLYPLSIIPLGFASGLWFAIFVGVMLGLFRGASDTALNAHGVQVERYYQRPIMSAFHAFYSLGGFLFGMIGSFLVGLFTDSAAMPFLICGGVLTVAGLVISRWLLDKDQLMPIDADDSDESAEALSKRSVAVILLMVGFGVLLLGSMFGESSLADWGQEFMRREHGTSTSLAGMAISLFIGAQCFGRLVGDRIAGLIGPAKMVGASGAIAVVGLLLATFGGATLAIVGFTLFGLGLACIAPLMLSSAGRKDPANAGRNIGIVNGIGYSGMLIAPAAISLIVSSLGIASLFYIPLVLLSLVAILGPVLMRSETGSHHHSSAAASNVQPS